MAFTQEVGHLRLGYIYIYIYTYTKALAGEGVLRHIILYYIILYYIIILEHHDDTGGFKTLFQKTKVRAATMGYDWATSRGHTDG